MHRALDETMRLLVAAVAAFGRDDLPLHPGFVTPSAVDGLAAAADIHRISGCLHATTGDLARLDPAVGHEFANAHHTNVVRHLTAVRSLGPVATELDRVGVRWLVMKGPVAATMLYRDAGARAYGDLDLLIHPRDLGAANDVLEGLGFVHRIKNWPLARRFRAGEFSMTGPAAELDVHWHIVYAWYDRRSVDLDLDAIFERVRRVDVSGRPVPTLDPVDTLMVIAVHASKSGGHRLIWLKDIERSITVESPDLDELVRRATASGLGPRVGVPLARAATLLGADVPNDVVRGLLPSASLRAIDRAVTTFSPPVRSHERDTLSRRWNRSLRSSTRTTVADVGHRVVRRVGEIGATLPGDESEDQVEKRRVLGEIAAGAGSGT